MAEAINFQPADTAIAAAEAAMAKTELLDAADFDSHLTTMQDIPEVAANQEAITTAAVELTQKFGIEASLVKDPAKMTVFTAIANRWSKAHEADSAEKTFLADSLALLANKNSQPLAQVYAHANRDKTEHSDKHIKSVIDRYTNIQMTDELKTAIGGGLLNAVKERLGITPDNEDPYELAVLTISDEYATFGMRTETVWYPERNDFDTDEAYGRAKQEFFDSMELYDDVKSWREGLLQRGTEFIKDSGQTGVPTAWKTELGGKTYLCIPQTFVEKILHPEAFVDEKSGYDQSNWESDFAILEHEYTHTQGGLNIDNELAFGINLEELRGEHFSDNRNGYTDIKNFARDFGVVTGTDLVDYIEAQVKGGEQDEVFKNIAKTTGLDAMLEVIMVQPQPYVDVTQNELVKTTNAHLGSYDGVVTRLLEKFAAKDGPEMMQTRIDARVKKIHSVAGDMGWFLRYRRSHGANVITNLLEARARELGYIDKN